MKNANFSKFRGFATFTPPEMEARASQYYKEISSRRSIRQFSSKAVSVDVIKQCLLAAGTAPSGANLQPWHFVVVSDSGIKKSIRESAEKEEELFYQGRAPEEWLQALAPLGTDAKKPFLEEAPYLIAIFMQRYKQNTSGEKQKNYYAQESVGIATGILISALHHAGLSTLTHTPSPMGFLNSILSRPENEKPFLLLVVGFAADDALVPDIKRKTLAQIATFV